MDKYGNLALTVRFSPEQGHEICRRARELGYGGAASLMRVVLLQWLQQERILEAAQAPTSLRAPKALRQEPFGFEEAEDE
jgi:hypothetical protein